MNIHIGERLGKVYDLFFLGPKYVKFALLNDIRYQNWRHCSEIYRKPDMYLIDGFIPKPDEVIYDVGSSYGDWAILWAKKYGAFVYAFEPLQRNLEIIHKNIIINNVQDRINIMDSLVGDGSLLSFKEGGDMITWSNNSLVHRYSDRLDDIFNLGWLGRNPDILKIDVEGFEHNVLLGAELLVMKFHPKIIIETHSSILRKQCTELLQNLGYTLKHAGRTVKGEDWMDEVTNLFFAVDGDVN